jgi:PAS domain S-box-containing protein
VDITPSSTRQTQILVVEDEPIVSLDLQQRLQKMGYRVPVVVASGEEAIESTQDSTPDLVLMDINLHGEMDGVEAAEQIRARHQVPVVYLTAYSNDQTLSRAKITEPFGYLLKPFEERELQTTIEIALHKHQAEQALRRAHDDLERRVSERTIELRHANLALQQEIDERRRREERQLALQRVREEVWHMRNRTDIQHVLDAIREGLTSLAVPFRSCRMYVVETRLGTENVRLYTRGDVDSWSSVPLEDQSWRDVILRVWRSGESAYRADIEEIDIVTTADDSVQQQATIRSVLDVPFSHGTLSIDSSRPQAFSDTDIAVLQEMAVALSEGFRRLEDLQQLAEERQRLAVTLRSIGDCVIATDADGRIVLLNRVAEALTGWTQDEARGREYAEVFTLEQTPAHDDPVAHVLETGTALTVVPTATLIARDSSERLVSTSSAPIRDDEGKTIGAVLVSRDVSEQRKIEEEQLKSAKLESLGVLAGGIAHDFNNILTTIIGYLSLSKMDLSPEGELYANLTEVEDASQRATDLTHQLLAFSKGGAPVKKAASIAELITDSATFTTRGSNVLCRFEIEEPLWAAEVDVGQISQVIQNLVLNADQAMPAGGAITITAGNTVIGRGLNLPLDPGEYISVSVIDHGDGISSNHLPQIFDPYFTTKEEGSGLGLATAYAIIKNHDGHITVDSSPNGTSFTVYIPATSTPADATPPDTGEIVPGQGRVLVVDDEAPIRRLAGDLLEKLGYEAELVGDGLQAITRYAQALESGRRFDAVIMDLTIRGGIGGRDAITELLEIDPGARVIVSSGYSADPAMAHFRRYGFVGVVAKPYDIRELSRVLGKVTRDPLAQEQ